MKKCLLAALGLLVLFLILSCGPRDPSGKYVYRENDSVLGELVVSVEDDMVTFTLTDFNAAETRSSTRPISKDGKYMFVIEGSQVPLTIEKDRITVKSTADTTLVFLKE